MVRGRLVLFCFAAYEFDLKGAGTFAQGVEAAARLSGETGRAIRKFTLNSRLNALQTALEYRYVEFDDA